MKGKPMKFPTGLSDAVDRARVFTEDSDDETIVIGVKTGGLRIAGWGPRGEYEEQRSFDYTGEKFTINIEPKLLKELSSRNVTECEICEDKKIKVEGDLFQYVACLLDDK
jgi:hypothetical protein